MESDIYLNGSECQKRDFSSEEDFEEFIENNSKRLFGEKTIFLRLKKQIESKAFGGTIPDGFLFDLSDTDNPQFYLVEVELKRHDFFSHIFPQITKFFSSKDKPENERKIIQEAYDYINDNSELREEFKENIPNKEIYKTIQDAVVNSDDVLLILDGKKEELDEVSNVYQDTWGGKLNTAIISEFNNGTDSVVSVQPKFEKIGLVDITGSSDSTVYDKDYHFKDTEDGVKEIFEEIISELCDYDDSIKTNTTKNYISLTDEKNFAYIKARKTKINIVITLPLNYGEEKIMNHDITELSEVVQDYYNSECFRVTLENNSNVQEVIEVLKEAHSRSIS